MNGYLMQEHKWTPGEDLFTESFSPENRYGVVFEDDGEAAYFYAVEKDENGAGLSILDALHINETADEDIAAEAPATPETSAAAKPLLIVWSRDWMACALIIDGFCHALFDFKAHGGYNINEFPPPNDLWTKGDRKLTDEIISRLF